MAGVIVIAAVLAGCGQNSPTGGGTNPTPTPTNPPAPTVTNIPLPTASSGPVTLSVGTTRYHATDTISVTLSNQSSGAIYFPDHLTNCTVILLQRQVGGDWQNVNMCKLMTVTRLHRMDTGKSLAVDLTPSPAAWLPGLYRATLHYSASQAPGGQAMQIYSAGFLVA